MGKPRLGKELYPKPPTYHPTGRTAAALGGVRRRGAQTRRGAVGGHGPGEPPPSSPHPPRPDSALRAPSNPAGPKRRHQPQPPVLWNSQEVRGPPSPLSRLELGASGRSPLPPPPQELPLKLSFHSYKMGTG